MATKTNKYGIPPIVPKPTPEKVEAVPYKPLTKVSVKLGIRHYEVWLDQEQNRLQVRSNNKLILKHHSERPNEITQDGSNHAYQDGVDVGLAIIASSDWKQFIIDHGLFIHDYKVETPKPVIKETKEPLDAVPSGFTWNIQQQAAIALASKGESFCLTGRPGTGKTTTTVEIAKRVVEGLDFISLEHKWLPSECLPFMIVSFTNAAVNNIKYKLPPELQENCLTIHKALEYSVEYVESVNEFGEVTSKQNFFPLRDAENKLDGVKIVCIEESTLVDLVLATELFKALPEDCIFIYLGDINQLPPVAGQSVFEKVLPSLQTVTLTETYRYEGDDATKRSPVKELVNDIIDGKLIGMKHKDMTDKYQLKNDQGEVNFHLFKRRVQAEALTELFCNHEKGFIQTLFSDDIGFTQYEDVILMPFNKKFGTVAINQAINHYYSLKAQNPVHEVIHGFTKSYWAAGDYVFYNKNKCIIQEIRPNTKYWGKLPAPAKVDLLRDGSNAKDPELLKKLANLDVDLSTSFDIPMHDIKTVSATYKHQDQTIDPTDNGRMSNQASHEILVYDTELEKHYTITSRGDVSTLMGCHAITVHKSQGSEWHRVFLLLHYSHNCMINRELLTTACSRVKNTLHIWADLDTLQKGSVRQVVKGDTEAEKIAWLLNKNTAQQVME